HDFFSNPPIEDSVPLQDQQPTIGVKFGERKNGIDPGVEAEATMPPEKLYHDLGFIDGLPLLFNAYRHRGGLSAWDPQNEPLFEPSAAAQN
ncbi:hypothetical protein, partial [Alkalibacillus haloalkaliphilus]|uniref:hypothetical protein n=1 Tax=Alkalibacillus haloalkaliphilus TaxID=94136 RepID=UPI0029357D60